MVTVNGVVLLRRDTEANWAYVNPLIADGEAALSTDKKNFKVGPGLWADLPYWLSNTVTNTFVVPFSAVSTVSITWQVQMPPGSILTYFQLFGNNVEAFVYFIGLPQGQPYSWTLDGSNNVDIVTFDWGSPQTGYIRF